PPGRARWIRTCRRLRPMRSRVAVPGRRRRAFKVSSGATRRFPPPRSTVIDMGNDRGIEALSAINRHPPPEWMLVCYAPRGKRVLSLGEADGLAAGAGAGRYYASLRPAGGAGRIGWAGGVLPSIHRSASGGGPLKTPPRSQPFSGGLTPSTLMSGRP